MEVFHFLKIMLQWMHLSLFILMITAVLISPPTGYIFEKILLTFLIRGYLLYSGVFISAVHQSGSALSTHICPSSWASLPRSPSRPSRSSRSTELSSCVTEQLPTSCLFHTWQDHCFLLDHAYVITHTHTHVYLSIYLSIYLYIYIPSISIYAL